MAVVWSRIRNITIQQGREDGTSRWREEGRIILDGLSYHIPPFLIACLARVGCAARWPISRIVYEGAAKYDARVRSEVVLLHFQAVVIRNRG